MRKGEAREAAGIAGAAKTSELSDPRAPQKYFFNGI